MRKYFCVLILIVALSNVRSIEDLESEEESSPAKGIMEECMDQEGYEPDDVTSALKSGKYHKLNCLQACMLTKMGLMQNGQFKVKKLSYFLKSHVNDMKQKIMNCAAKVSRENHERCDVPLEIQNCLLNGDGEILY